ncbi:SNF2-related protein [Candidatus Pacearchaeota archaeon]|jgi:hypothetical protein|nr:SNF2-related protein [Candidatus Pacearchaeota archaeon]
MIVNKYAKKCQCCGRPVGVGKGWAYNNGNGWFTTCASSACHRHLGLEVPQSVTANANVRKLTEDGKVYMAYDRDAVPLLRAMPGASFNPENLPKDQVYWQVSIKPADLPRVVEIADQLKLEVHESLRALVEAGTAESREAVARATAISVNGKTLFGFQTDGVKALALHDRFFLADDMGLGKAQPVSEPVLTPKGWVPIGTLKVGDFVIGSNGRPTRVDGVFPQGVKDIFEIVLSDDARTRCCEDHLWAVQTPNDRVRNPGRIRVLSLKDLNALGLKDRNENHKFFIPMVRPVEFEETDLPMHPYLLGALIANGGLCATTITHAGDDEQRGAFKEYLPVGIYLSQSDDYTYRLSYLGPENQDTNPITQVLDNLCLKGLQSQDRFVPEEYMLASVEQRLSLLQGLLDNDGTISKDGMCIEYNTTSPVLASQVCSLVRSLGGIALMSSRIPLFTHNGEKKAGLPDFRIRIKLPSGMVPFRIPRKVERFIPPTKYPSTHAITDIFPAGQEDCVCIRVEAKDHLYVTRDYILTHNTVQAIVALPDNERVLVICPASLKYNWRDEIQMWRPSYRVTICSGKEETVAKTLAEGKKTKAIPFKIPEPGEIVICNYDILPNYLAPKKDSGKVSKKGKPILVANLTPEQEQALSETNVIGDEFHLVKNYKTARAQKVGQVTRISKRVWALSGTPLMNNPLDLFGVLSAGNINVFGSWDNFLRLFNGYKNQWGGYEFGMPLPEVPERMQRVMLRRLKTEVLKDLPPKVYQDIEVDDGTLTKTLNTFLGKVTGKKIDDDFDYEAELDIEELPDFKEFSEIRAMLARSRIPAMLEMVESYEDSGTPLVVFSAHKEPIEALQDRAGWRIITGDTDPETRRNFVKEFQDGLLKGIALTIKTGGVGFTLTRATNALFVDLDWTPSWNIQAEDRLVRIGATGSHVLIMRMRSNHPLDRHIQKLLKHKIALAYLALEASIKFKPPPPRLPGVAVIQETDDEMMARIQVAGDEVEREIALDRLQGVLARESAKVNNVPEPELTPGRKEMLRDALEYMISVCDGAETRDQMGFNKPDAFMARWVGMCLREEDEVSFRVLERILVRYRRQLKGRFEEIWKPANDFCKRPNTIGSTHVWVDGGK